jgi:hypothetical protein
MKVPNTKSIFYGNRHDGEYCGEVLGGHSYLVATAIAMRRKDLNRDKGGCRGVVAPGRRVVSNRGPGRHYAVHRITRQANRRATSERRGLGGVGKARVSSARATLVMAAYRTSSAAIRRSNQSARREAFGLRTAFTALTTLNPTIKQIRANMFESPYMDTFALLPAHIKRNLQRFITFFT